MVVRSKAPLRFNFAGGGTDLEPYKNENGGLVASATIDKYAYGSLIVRQDRNIVVQSLDYDFMAKYHLDDEMPFEGELDLAKAVIDGLKADFKYGFDFFIHSDAPPGSGLGSSSALVVALIGLIKHLQRMPLTSREIAELAYQIERTDLGIEGGMHDQFSAVFGGFNSIEFSKSAAIVDPLRVEPEIVNELEYNLLLCYTGRTRISAKIICTQVQACERKVPEVLKALDESKEIAVALRKALLQGRLNEFGRLLHTAWTIKNKSLSKLPHQSSTSCMPPHAKAAQWAEHFSVPAVVAIFCSIVSSARSISLLKHLKNSAARSSNLPSNSADCRPGQPATDSPPGDTIVKIQSRQIESHFCTLVEFSSSSII